MNSIEIENTKNDNVLPNDFLGVYMEKEFEYFNHFEIGKVPEIIWKRPIDLVDDPCLLETYDQEIDGYIICGSQTPAWFPIVITLLKTKNILHLVVKDIKKQDNFNKSSYIGCFEFSFFGKNMWTTILIDDKLPHIAGENKSLYCVSSNKEEFLPSLLEKAYARFLGGYGKLQTVDFLDVLMNFTGGIVESVDLKRNISLLTYQEQKILFKKLRSSVSDVMVIGLTNSNQEEKTDFPEDNNNFVLAHDHYYLISGFTEIPLQSNLNLVGTVISSFLDIHNHECINLLRLHNPVLNGDWNGAFSVGSPEWEGINESVRRVFNLKFNHEFEFWITMKDFIRNMKNIILCHIPSYSYVDRFLKGVKVWSSFHHNGIYSSLIPGGSIKSLDDEFLKNDQYLIEVYNQNLIEMKFVLTMNNIDKSLRYDTGCCLTLLKVESNRLYRLHDLQNSEISNLRLLSESGSMYSVSTTLCKGKYILIPWRKEISEVEYYLRIYSSQKSINISLLLLNQPPFVQCLKCSLVNTILNRKEFLNNVSGNCESPNDSFTKHRCSSCFSVNPQSAVRITIVSAYGLESNEDNILNTRSVNSYFVIKYPNFTYRSNTKYLSNKPQWNESFIVYRNAKQRDDISIELFAEQRIGFDKSFGIHYFSETDLCKDEIVAGLRIPVNKEWVYTPAKIIAKFKNYLPSSFDSM